MLAIGRLLGELAGLRRHGLAITDEVAAVPTTAANLVQLSSRYEQAR